MQISATTGEGLNRIVPAILEAVGSWNKRVGTSALNRFLDPLNGGPEYKGWPFGRDVYRSEILQVVDQVRGVDHVLELTISADGRAVACGNLCVPPTWLVTSGAHVIEVTTT